MFRICVIDGCKSEYNSDCGLSYHRFAPAVKVVQFDGMNHASKFQNGKKNHPVYRVIELRYLPKSIEYSGIMSPTQLIQKMMQAFDKIVQPYYYVVVRFIDKPSSIVDYVCVPDFWIKPIGSTDLIVSVAYPVEIPVRTTYRAKMGETPRDHWKLYQAAVKYVSKTYSGAEKWIARYHATVKNKSSNEKGPQLVSALDLSRSSEYFPSTLNTDKLQTVVAPSKPSQKPMTRVTPVVRKEPEDIHEKWSQTAKAVESTKQSLFDHIDPTDLKIYVENITKCLSAVGQSSSNLTKNSSQQPKRSVQKQVAPVIQNSLQEVPRTQEKRRQISPVYLENLSRETYVQEIVAERSKNVQVNMAITPQIFQNPSNEPNQSSPHQSAEFLSTRPSLSVYKPPKRTESENIAKRLVAAGQSSSLTKESPHQPERLVQKRAASVIENSPQVVSRTPKVRRQNSPVDRENLVRELVAEIQEIVDKSSNDVQSNMDTTTPTVQNPSNERNQFSSHQLAELLSTRPSLSVFIKPVDKGTRLENASTATRNPPNCSQQPNSSVEEVPAPVTQNTSQVPRIPEKQVEKSGGTIQKVRLQDNTDNANDRNNLVQCTPQTEAIVNKKSTQQNSINQATPQSLTEATRSTKRHVRRDALTVPPKYNRNNSKWTLKYRKHVQGLEELVLYSGIYVNAIELSHCKRSSNNCNTLARMLLREVFSHKALTSCSLNGARSNVHDGNKIKPGLDAFAIKAILKFVEEYGGRNNWDKFDTKSVTQSMHYEISKIRNAEG